MTTRSILRGVLGGLLALLLLFAAVLLWAQLRVRALQTASRADISHEVPVPFPDPEGAGATDDPLGAAVERGRHLVQARLGCEDCHAADFSGGLAVDAWPVMVLYAPNITPGGAVATWSTQDWDRLVRFGVLPNGNAALMPVIESTLISDQELSDVIAYARSLPASDAKQRPPKLGLLGALAMALGELHFSADEIDRATPRPLRPPPVHDVLATGEHIAHTCKGCHGADLSGGYILGGDPSWPPAADLRPGPDALGDWTEAQFITLMRTGVRPDGTDVDPVMPFRISANMTDEELSAMWAWLRTLPTGETP